MKNRPGWPKVSKLKHPDGTEETATDSGLVKRTKRIAPKLSPLDYPRILKEWSSRNQPTLVERLKGAETNLKEWLLDGDCFPDQKPSIEDLISEIKRAISDCEQGDWEEAAEQVFEIGYHLAILKVDSNLRLSVQAKRDIDSAAKKPRGLSPAWEAVRNALVPGLTWRAAFRIFNQAGGKSEAWNFRRSLKRHQKKLGH